MSLQRLKEMTDTPLIHLKSLVIIHCIHALGLQALQNVTKYHNP